ncbi:MAG: hypothetical protein U1F49_15330 [Rubrivivax sp.]
MGWSSTKCRRRCSHNEWKHWSPACASADCTACSSTPTSRGRPPPARRRILPYWSNGVLVASRPALGRRWWR